MKQISALVVILLSGLAVICQSANAQMQMQMRQPPISSTNNNLIPREFLDEDQWVNSIVDRWPAAQRKSWRSLDRRFSGWASHLVWLRKSAGRLSGEVSVPAPRVPSDCPVDPFVAPTYSVAESMDHFREVMPEVDWNAWANIDPTFRSIAEWEMSIEHYKAQASKTLNDWWTRNDGAVRTCLVATLSSGGDHAQNVIAAVSVSQSPPNPRYAQIDRRVRSEQSAIDHLIAPDPVKKEAHEQISDAAAVEKYAADVDDHRR